MPLYPADRANHNVDPAAAADPLADITHANRKQVGRTIAYAVDSGSEHLKLLSKSWVSINYLNEILEIQPGFRQK